MKLSGFFSDLQSLNYQSYQLFEATFQQSASLNCLKVDRIQDIEKNKIRFFWKLNKTISKPSLKSEKEIISPAQSTGLTQVATAAAGNRRQITLRTSNQKDDSTLQQSVLCQLSLLFPLGSLKTPVNESKWVLSLSLLFLKVCCYNFLYQAGLPSINVWLITCYANLISTYHTYQTLSSDLSVQMWGLGRWLEVW